MANILFVESDPVAVKAFTGIMNRSVHKFHPVTTVEAAWEALEEEKYYDLVILEVRLEGGSGKALITEIRNHPFYNNQQILVYSKMSDKRSIRQILVLDVQNFLLKPYHDDKLYAEINKAHNIAWWTEYFTREDHVCDRLGITREDLAKRYKEIWIQLKQFPVEAADIGDNHLVAALKLKKLLDGAGFDALLDYINDLEEHIKNERVPQLQKALPHIAQAKRLIQERINPGKYTYPRKEEVDEIKEEEVTEKKVIRNVQKACDWKEMQEKIDAMEGYPVVDTVAASFQMAALNTEIEIEVLVDMIETDPCLAVQVIYYCNAVTTSGKSTVAITDPKQAIQMFGLSRIRAVASSVITIPEDALTFRGFGWKDYWTFQMGCARLSEEIVVMLSLPLNENIAFFSGLVHEMGKIIFAYYYPDAFEYAMQVASSTSVPLTDTEKHYFGCTHEQVGKYFAEQSKLPSVVAACCGHYREPEKALPEYREMVAVVSLANYLCQLFEIGFSGSRLPKNITSFAGHPSWQVLKPILYHGFTVAKFERACKERVLILKRELGGLSEKRH